MGNSNGKPVVLTDEVNLNHFRLLRVVGKGAFGKVRIVERKDTGLTFALKYIRKDEVVRSESVRNIIRERRMLEHLNHPFLCNLRYSFQDIEYLYIVVDLMNGGDLRFHISRKTFTEEAVRFWIAELGCALRYIHRQGIVHRDVKPDNILLDSDGHVHLADFNVASEFTPHKPLTSKSGTLAYLAPEVYEGKGYSCEVDWWSLGVVFYECIYNKRPFEPRDHNHESLSSLIKKAEPAFPNTNPPVSMPCLHAMSSLLEKNKKRRIGAAGFETFTDNPFFRAINFNKLERKEIEPIFMPSSDKTNFDATYDLEELLLEEAPLEARARRQKPREQLKEDATQQEIRADELHKMIETLFEPFNYQLVSETRPSAQSSPTSEQTGARARTPTDPYRPASGHKLCGDDGNALRTTPSGRSQSYMPSRNGSPPRGSPPLATSKSALPSSNVTEHQNDYFERPANATHQNETPVSFSRPNRRVHHGSSQNINISGGIRDVLGDKGSSPSDAADQKRTNTGNDEKPVGTPKPSGMLGFLSRKKGRDRSPKAKERGVLGKDGARVVVGN